MVSLGGVSALLLSAAGGGAVICGGNDDSIYNSSWQWCSVHGDKWGLVVAKALFLQKQFGLCLIGRIRNAMR